MSVVDPGPSHRHETECQEKTAIRKPRDGFARSEVNHRKGRRKMEGETRSDGVNVSFTSFTEHDPDAAEIFAEEEIPSEAKLCGVTIETIVMVVSCLDLFLIGCQALLLYHVFTQGELVFRLLVCIVNLPFAFCGLLSTMRHSIWMLACYSLWRLLWFIIWVFAVLFIGGQVALRVLQAGGEKIALGSVVLLVVLFLSVGVIAFQVFYFRILANYYKHMDVFSRRRQTAGFLRLRQESEPGGTPLRRTSHAEAMERLQQIRSEAAARRGINLEYEEHDDEHVVRPPLPPDSDSDEESRSDGP